MRPIWFIFGILSLAIGVLGIFLPLLPTVPLVLLAAFCFARSSPRMHSWLTNHKVLGPMIADWNAHGAISIAAKRAATVSILLVFGLSVWMDLKALILGIQAVVLSCVMLFIWTRPSS